MRGHYAIVFLQPVKGAESISCRKRGAWRGHPCERLRERRSDIALLATHFVDVARRRLGVGSVRLTPEAQDLLVAADWPGNVREVKNVLSRAVLRASFGLAPNQPVTVGTEHLDIHAAVSPMPSRPQTAASVPAKILSLRDQLDEFQRRVIRESLERHGGKWAAVARELGLHRSNLHTLATRLGLRHSDSASS